MMKLTIKILGEEVVVDVTPSTTIGELKHIVAPHLNLSTKRIRLSVKNGGIQHLDNDQKTVSDYNLSSESIVMLMITPLQIFVKNETGKLRTYDITADENTDQLMEKVSKKEGKKVDQMRLIYEGKQLASGKKLKDYGIKSESTIFMTLNLRGG